MAGTGDQLQGGLVSHALRAVGEGLSANAWLRTLSESGAGVRRAVGLRIYGEAKALAAEYGQEPTRGLGTVPTHQEARPWPTQRTDAILQTVRLYYRENVTGNILSRYYNVKSPEGVTRGEAVDRAVQAYQNAPPASQGGSRPVEAEFIGAVHVGAATLTATET